MSAARFLAVGERGARAACDSGLRLLPRGAPTGACGTGVERGGPWAAALASVRDARLKHARRGFRRGR